VQSVRDIERALGCTVRSLLHIPPDLRSQISPGCQVSSQNAISSFSSSVQNSKAKKLLILLSLLRLVWHLGDVCSVVHKLIEWRLKGGRKARMAEGELSRRGT
jgi:hypothetical protein